MKLFIRIFCILLVLFAPVPVLACIPISVPKSDDLIPAIERAELVFVGQVLAATSNTVEFKVIKSVKNIKDGEIYSGVLGQLGLFCKKVEAGQVWLFLRYPEPQRQPGELPVPVGAGPPQFGVYLRSQYGEYSAANHMIKEKLGYDLTAENIPSQEMPASVAMKLYDGAMSKQQQGFEQLLKRLMLIAKNDTYSSGWSPPKKIDMDSRKQFFTDKGWTEYQSYVQDKKTVLDNLRDRRLAQSDRIKGKFVYGTQKYITDAHNRTDFSAYGEFCYGAYDEGVCGVGHRFQIKISITKGDIQTLDGIRIDSWSVQPLK